MTEEIRTQITKASKSWASHEDYEDSEESAIAEESYRNGAKDQDEIAEKRGYNLSIQDCVEFISKKIDLINAELPIVGNQTTRIMQAVKEELEKLKK
jgi:hypothetical protein